MTESDHISSYGQAAIASKALLYLLNSSLLLSRVTAGKTGLEAGKVILVQQECIRIATVGNMSEEVGQICHFLFQDCQQPHSRIIGLLRTLFGDINVIGERKWDAIFLCLRPCSEAALRHVEHEG